MRYKPMQAWSSVSENNLLKLLFEQIKKEGKEAHARVSFDSFFAVRFVAKRYILQKSVWTGK